MNLPPCPNCLRTLMLVDACKKALKRLADLHHVIGVSAGYSRETIAILEHAIACIEQRDARQESAQYGTPSATKGIK